MMPWLPIELIKVNSANVYATDIITVVEPKEEMIQYYGKLVARLSEDLKESGDHLQRLLDEEDEELGYEEDDGPLTEEQLDQLLKNVKSSKLH
jgi:hypothetical protein